MRSKFILALFCGLLFTGVQAQTPSATTAPTGVGVLIAQLADNIAPEAFTPEFLKNKKGWMEKARLTNDSKGAAWLLKSLQGGLNSTSFASSWTTVKDKWLTDATSIKTVKDAASQLNILSANINPTMLSSTWNSVKPAWNAGVNGLAK